MGLGLFGDQGVWYKQGMIVHPPEPVVLVEEFCGHEIRVVGRRDLECRERYDLSIDGEVVGEGLSWWHAERALAPRVGPGHSGRFLHLAKPPLARIERTPEEQAEWDASMEQWHWDEEMAAREERNRDAWEEAHAEDEEVGA